MPQPQPKNEQPFIVTNTPLAISIVALAILVVSSLMWWTKVHDSPNRVFNGMLRNNLSVTSVTRTTTSLQDTGFSKVEQISFVSPSATHALITIDQPEESGGSKVRTETIGTLTNDFSRYLSISTSQKSESGKDLDFSSVKGVWGKTEGGARPAYFAEAMQGIVPFANLGPVARDQVIESIKTTKAYEVDFANVKPKRIGRKSALVYPVKVNLEAYVTIIKDLSKSAGVPDTSSLNPEDYKGQPPIEISLTVDKLSRQVLEVSYGQQSEEYTSYGLKNPVALPTKTIPAESLQQKVQEIK